MWSGLEWILPSMLKFTTASFKSLTESHRSLLEKKNKWNSWALNTHLDINIL